MLWLPLSWARSVDILCKPAADDWEVVEMGLKVYGSTKRIRNKLHSAHVKVLYW